MKIRVHDQRRIFFRLQCRDIRKDGEFVRTICSEFHGVKQYIRKASMQADGTELQTQRACVGIHGSMSVCATNDLECLLPATVTSLAQSLIRSN